MSERIRTYEEFWAFYLSEHRSPASRRLHFAGTTGWLAACAGATLTAPFTFPPAMAAFAALAAHGTKKGEAEGPAYAHVAGMLGIPALTSPLLFPAGVAFAYACSWGGHFGIEKNRPATFDYPLWSFVSDLRMWSHMVRGQLWSGDPLEELNIEAPPSARHAAGNGASEAVAA